MRYLPLFWDTRGRVAVVAGGGEAALQKVRTLLDTEADTRVFAPHPHGDLEALAADGRIVLCARAALPEDLDTADLVYVATDDPALDASLSRLARARRIPVNVVDNPNEATVISPAIVNRDPVVVAIGTEGTAPLLGRRIKTTLERTLPAGLGALAQRVGAWRQALKARGLSDSSRRRALDAMIGAALDGINPEAHLDRFTEQAQMPRGRILLVGAGPGDPELLTLKALRALQQADVLVIDRLVDDAVVAMARKEAKRIHVGKTPGGESTHQDAINRILVEEALKGQVVVRLKGGDPMVLGRGQEELDAAAAADIPVEIVPGITAALGCAAAAQIPVTRRGEGRALILATGATKDGPAEHAWHDWARSGQTIALYMGVRAAPHVRRRLLDAGMDPATPVTVVENGTRANQKVAVGVVDDLPDVLMAEGIRGPAVIYIGVHPHGVPAVASTSAVAGGAL